ncbi:MAG: hypothetical protein COV57_03325 [Candidatus Liptonbacteria bacterium CG11_big_fil_rev_8_21_14_0_20_35_14]|uniref:Segregation and condensation protein A n=1 Tax=Candidatus Liptonbacteria bacterium CG11_big_fil_rev_8_21_14_0_20_35_14 TaxID=1974634 RepID=A0A2H0N6V7_9BACT|nr:MAG: hypothetical protein COV57_03325 [Candidatus Liptonbacteria bacterium CG11_big_fil_rev_8_21_14_0_20_35_14]
MTYHFKSTQFSGPLETLLALIESRKMDISTVSLSEVTADFLQYIEKLKAIDNSKSVNRKIIQRTISDFIVIASQLLLIKSKNLLPQVELTGEEESEIADLEERLKLYKEVKKASYIFLQQWKNKERYFSRELLKNKKPVFYATEDINLENLKEIIEKLSHIVKIYMEEEEMPREKAISLAEKIQELIFRINNSNTLALSEVAKNKQKREIIALFLAVLHLIRDKVIEVEQTENFGDVILKKL